MTKEGWWGALKHVRNGRYKK